MNRRWLFADQLGPHFLDQADQPVLLVESRRAFARRPVHRRRAHLVLSALRHRAAELGDQALLVQADTYREGRAKAGGELTVCAPTSWAARRLAEALPGVTVLPARGFGTGEQEFADWAAGRGRRRLVLEDFYRDARQRLGILMDGPENERGPAGGRWNFDADNREPPPADGLRLKSRPAVTEDEVDAHVRRDLDAWQRSGDVRLTGEDGPREFPVTRAEALAALRAFVRDRLPAFGPQQDAMLAADPEMAHSLLSPALNLGLLDPVECAQRPKPPTAPARRRWPARKASSAS